MSVGDYPFGAAYHSPQLKSPVIARLEVDSYDGNTYRIAGKICLELPVENTVEQSMRWRNSVDVGVVRIP